MNVNSKFMVIQETSPQRFERELESAAIDGYMIVSSNLTVTRHKGEIIYYALMSKKSQREGLREIPVLEI
jgi:hypothetical protein